LKLSLLSAMVQDLHKFEFSIGNLWKWMELPLTKRFEQAYAAQDFTIF